jgi:hypothetical protein
MTPEERQRYSNLRALAARLPQNANVAASKRLIPHVSSHPDARTLETLPADVEYLLIDRKGFKGDDRRNGSRIMQKEPYGLVESIGHFYLFQKNHESPRTKAAFAELAIANVAH